VGHCADLLPSKFLFVVVCSSFSSIVESPLQSTMRTSLWLSITAVASICAAELNARQGTASNWTVGQTVQTSSGPVSGHAATNQTGVSEYLGIPFAQPPIGDLRFEAPVKYTGNSPLNGTRFVRGIKTTFDTIAKLLSLGTFLSGRSFNPYDYRGLFGICECHHNWNRIFWHFQCS
jgi:hypothetical protein